MSFGAGIHFCLGAALARAEGHVVFDRLLDRFPVIEPDVGRRATAVPRLDRAARSRVAPGARRVDRAVRFTAMTSMPKTQYARRAAS